MSDDATSAVPASEPAASAGGGGCGGCGCGAGGCGGGGSQKIPELDARTLHPALRNSAIFGCLIGLLPGSAMDLVIGEDPQPLVELVDMKLPDAFTVTYLRRGPEVWELTFLRAG